LRNGSQSKPSDAEFRVSWRCGTGQDQDRRAAKVAAAMFDPPVQRHLRAELPGRYQCHCVGHGVIAAQNPHQAPYSRPAVTSNCSLAVGSHLALNRPAVAIVVAGGERIVPPLNVGDGAGEFGLVERLETEGNFVISLAGPYVELIEIVQRTILPIDTMLAQAITDAVAGAAQILECQPRRPASGVAGFLEQRRVLDSRLVGADHQPPGPAQAVLGADAKIVRGADISRHAAIVGKNH